MSLNDPVREQGSGIPGLAGLLAAGRARLHAWQTPLLVGLCFVFGVSALIVGAVGIGPSASVADGHGNRGYFTARTFVCFSTRRSCEWRGDFTIQRGGADRREHVYDRGNLPAGMHAGEAVAAVDTGAPSYVFQPGNSTGLLAALAFTIIGAILALGSAAVTVARLRSGRWPTPTRRYL